MILNTYIEELDGINLTDIAKDFVHNEHRKKLFWRIYLIHITCSYSASFVSCLIFL